MNWTADLAAALNATLREATRERCTMDRARRRIWHRSERNGWKARTGKHGPGASEKWTPNNRAAKRAAAKARGK